MDRMHIEIDSFAFNVYYRIWRKNDSYYRNFGNEIRDAYLGKGAGYSRHGIWE